MSDHLYDTKWQLALQSTLYISPLSDVGAVAQPAGPRGWSGGVPAAAAGPDGPHHQGLAAGRQQCGLQGQGPRLCCQARQTIRCRLEGLVSGAEERGRVDPGGPRGPVRDSRRDDPGQGQEGRQVLGDALPHLLQPGCLQVGVGPGYLRRQEAAEREQGQSHGEGLLPGAPRHGQVPPPPRAGLAQPSQSQNGHHRLPK